MKIQVIQQKFQVNKIYILITISLDTWDRLADSKVRVGRPDVLQILEKSEDEQEMVLILEQYTSLEATIPLSKQTVSKAL